MTITETTPLTDYLDACHDAYIRRAAGLGITAYERAGLDENGRDETGTDWSDWVVEQ